MYSKKIIFISQISAIIQQSPDDRNFNAEKVTII